MRHSAYAAKPAASAKRSHFPKASSARVASAPSRLVDLPPCPTASWSASTPTIANEAPFATSPARASGGSQSLRTCRRTHERLFEVRDEIVDRLDADRKAHEVRRRGERRVRGGR